LKEHRTLYRLRAILAILIAFALMLAPLNAAWAVVQMRAASGEVATAAPSADTAMSDCMKAMQAQGQAQDEPQDQNCPCCDTPLKSNCPDMGSCLAKCSVQVIAAFAPDTDRPLPLYGHNWPADPQKPPDWAFAPPAPPPRA
jgi:hypothetical protein